MAAEYEMPVRMWRYGSRTVHRMSRLRIPEVADHVIVLMHAARSIRAQGGESILVCAEPRVFATVLLPQLPEPLLLFLFAFLMNRIYSSAEPNDQFTWLTKTSLGHFILL